MRYYAISIICRNMVMRGDDCRDSSERSRLRKLLLLINMSFAPNQSKGGCVEI